MRGIRCVLAAVLAAGIVTVVAAQPGRMFFGGGQDVHTLVFTNAALQEEIKVTPAQKEKIKPFADKYTELNKKRGEMFAKGFKDFDKEKAAELREEGKKLDEESKKAYDEIFTADQKKRLNQIAVQAMGLGVFTEPGTKGGGGKGGGGQNESAKATRKEVADALKLTDAQKTKINDLLEEYGKDIGSIAKDIFGEAKGKGAFDPDKQKEFQTKNSKLSTEFMGKIADVLDDTQKKRWKELVGEPFDVNKLRPVFPKKD
jgi:hypothetical protein